MGILEALELSNLVGDKALTIDEVFFMAYARKVKGCTMKGSTLDADERRRVLSLGQKCKKWKEENM